MESRSRWIPLDERDSAKDPRPTGQCITSTVLHDATGAIGFADQVLTVRPESSRWKLDPDRGVAGQKPTALEGVAGEQDAG
jgi:hypothetical protein